MLILTRKPNESFTIGDGIVVRVLRVRGEYVRLGIVAPAAMRIARDDLKPKAELPGPIAGELRETEE